MGLDTTHNAFHGAYSAFNRLRQEVARARGGSFPPHYDYAPDGSIKERDGRLMRKEGLDDQYIYWADDFDKEGEPGLYEFLIHSDCDGEIAPDMCLKVADELERLLPKIAAGSPMSGGHIAAYGGFVKTVELFIAGCRAAAAEGVPLEFH